jgi:branched-chain amino acid transport system permease protein
MSYGLAIIYGVMKVVNLSHAGFLMLGAFMTLVYSQTWHLDPIAGAFLNLPLFFLAGWVVYVTLVRRVRQALPIASLLMLFGLWLVLQNVALTIWGSEDQSIITRYTYKALPFFDYRIALTRLVVFAVALAVMAVLHVVLNHTYVGKALRATVQDPQAALLAGIDTERISALAFGLGTAFAGFAGGLMTLLFSFTPDFGAPFQLKSFTIIVLGGLENLAGVTAGAAILAFAESFAVLFMRASLQNVVAYALLVVALIIMPGGITSLFGRRS